jgi:ABC-type phosphate/phosphonate transport system substrate-binding protein
MKQWVAALPMYDWPERRGEVDAEWASIRDRLKASGIEAPDALARRNGDLPAVPGGIRDAAGRVIASDPASLAPDDLDYPTLWRHPALLVAQTCWGPMLSTGLRDKVVVLAQPSYDGIKGGEGTHYSSAVVMRAADQSGEPVPAPADGRACLPLELLRGQRLAFNDAHSMSGLLGLETDLESAGETLALFSQRCESGGHRLSVRAVAQGRADVATIDCRSWQLALRHEPSAAALKVVGWTARRLGLPFIASRNVPPDTIAVLKSALGGG